MPNPSELARREGELSDAVARVNNLKLGKSDREAALREVRVLERELGVEALGTYNGQPSAQEQQDEVIITYDQLRFAKLQLSKLSLFDVGTLLFALRNSDGLDELALLDKLGIKA